MVPGVTGNFLLGHPVHSNTNCAVEGKCPESRCTFSTNPSVENQAAADAVVFHMPNYHWEKYSSPELRNPAQNWIFMSYETATNVRLRYPVV